MIKNILTTLICVILYLNANSSVHIINSGNYYYTDISTGTSSSVINAGDTVVWLRDAGFHNVNFDISSITGNSFNNPVSFVSSPTNNDTIFSYVFNVPGYYQYDCSVGSHAASGMVGDITVNNTVYNIVANSQDHSTLKVALDASALDGVLSGPGPFTLFAPTDAAFNNLPPGTLSNLLNNIPQLWDVLIHHVITDSVMSSMLSNNQIVTSLLGTDITVTINNGMVYIDNAVVTVADIIADNGVVHVIDAVLLPNFDCNGVLNGSSIIDSCGVCQQSYIYNFITHQVTILSDTFGVSLGMNEILVMADDPANPYWNSSCTGNSIYDVVSNSSDHTTLKAAIDACSLDVVLSTQGPFTLFAPTDGAFNNLPSGTVSALLNNIPQLTDILLHHVVNNNVMSSMLSNNQVVTTLLGTDVTVTIINGMVYIDNAMVTVADIVADNGVVHVIDAVLLPTVSTNSIYDVVSNSSDHTTLKAAIDACSLDGTLSGTGPFTLFAPTDGAFNNLPAGTVTALLNDIPQLTDILLHHVVGDSVMSSMLSNNQVVTTLLGTDVTVTINNGMVYIDNAMVTVADIVADNGVVHVIDAVLLPTVSSIENETYNYNNNSYLYSINILGKRVENNSKDKIIFDIYNNGTVIKRFNP